MKKPPPNPSWKASFLEKRRGAQPSDQHLLFREVVSQSIMSRNASRKCLITLIWLLPQIIMAITGKLPIIATKVTIVLLAATASISFDFNYSPLTY